MKIILADTRLHLQMISRRFAHSPYLVSIFHRVNLLTRRTIDFSNQLPSNTLSLISLKQRPKWSRKTNYLVWRRLHEGWLNPNNLGYLFLLSTMHCVILMMRKNLSSWNTRLRLLTSRQVNPGNLSLDIPCYESSISAWRLKYLPSRNLTCLSFHLRNGSAIQIQVSLKSAP